MNIQELLTYVEELTFKNSMFGYDKDEVDVQLDKICDEIEAIVKAKDKEIAALRGGESVIVEDEAADKEEAPAASPAADEPAPVFGDSEEVEELERQLAEAKAQLEEALARAEEAEQRAEEARAQALEAEEAAAASEERAKIAERRIAEQEKELESLSMAASVQGAQEITAPQMSEEEPEGFEIAEEPEEITETKAPADTDAAYRQYIRNADLLCRQLSALDDQKDGIIKEAQTEADSIIRGAQTEADGILKDANEQAEGILADAGSQAEKIIADHAAEEEK